MAKDERQFNFPRRQQRLVVAGGGIQQVALFHGVIIEQCNANCSTYRVQRVRRYLLPECDGSNGSGSGSGQ